MIRAYEKVITRFPDDTVYTPAAYIGVGEIYRSFRRHEDAVKMYHAALKQYPDQEDIQLFALYGLGLSYDRMRDYNKAQAYYKECIDRFGDDEREEFKKIVRECEILYSQVRTE
jgi:tetratricopeptide (TPR) repeat protein